MLFVQSHRAGARSAVRVEFDHPNPMTIPDNSDHLIFGVILGTEINETVLRFTTCVRFSRFFIEHSSQLQSDLVLEVNF